MENLKNNERKMKAPMNDTLFAHQKMFYIFICSMRLVLLRQRHCHFHFPFSALTKYFSVRQISLCFCHNRTIYRQHLLLSYQVISIRIRLMKMDYTIPNWNEFFVSNECMRVTNCCVCLLIRYAMCVYGTHRNRLGWMVG